nr:CAAX amino protease family protein [Streptococcus thermophilus]
MWLFAALYVAWGIRGFFIRFDAPIAMAVNAVLAGIGVWAFREVIAQHARGLAQTARQPLRIAGILALFLGWLIAGSVIFSIAINLMGLAEYELENDGAVGEIVVKQSALVSVAWMAVLGPAGEELFFRGFLIRFFGQWAAPGWAIVASAVIFGLGHASGVSAAELIFVVPHIFAGLGFALVAWKGGIVLSFLLHAAVNTLSLLPMLIP